MIVICDDSVADEESDGEEELDWDCVMGGNFLYVLLLSCMVERFFFFCFFVVVFVNFIFSRHSSSVMSGNSLEGEEDVSNSYYGV